MKVTDDRLKIIQASYKVFLSERYSQVIIYFYHFKLFPCYWQLLLSANNLCKQFGSKMFDTLMVFLKEFFEKVNQKKKKNPQTTKKNAWNYLACKELISNSPWQKMVILLGLVWLIHIWVNRWIDWHILTIYSRIYLNCTATDKALFSSEKCWYLSYFSAKTYVVSTH